MIKMIKPIILKENKNATKLNDNLKTMENYEKVYAIFTFHLRNTISIAIKNYLIFNSGYYFNGYKMFKI